MPERAKETAFVRFYQRAVSQKFQSEEEGRPIYKQFDYVEIRQPGEDKQVVDRKVCDLDKERWPEQWARYQRGQEQVADGTPLSEWPNLGVTEVARLKSINIHTIEHLAGLDDMGLQKLGPGARELQKQAKYFLEEAVPTSAVANLKGMYDRLIGDALRLIEKQPWGDDDAGAAAGLAEHLTRHCDTVESEFHRVEERHQATLESFRSMRAAMTDGAGTLAKRLAEFAAAKDRAKDEQVSATLKAAYPAEEARPSGDAPDVLSRLAALEAENQALREERAAAKPAPDAEPEPLPGPKPEEKHVLGRGRRKKKAA